jgi:UDP-N-acetylmuramoylalanine--D-glutamate ligase
MKIAILGFGVEGQAAYQYWKSSDNSIIICDIDSSVGVPDDCDKQIGEHYLENLDQYDLVVRSPAIHPDKITEYNGQSVKSKVTSVTNEFFRVCPTSNIIGVTGTKGKGTTSTLITKILEAAGKKVHLGGNIGVAPLEMLKSGIDPDDWVVLELSSFQLTDIRYSPHIAICLLVVPEHLNWHTDMNDYVRAKQQLFIHQVAGDMAIYFADSVASEKVASPGDGKKIPYFKEPGAYVKDGEVIIGDQHICRTDEIKLLGQHNWQNVCASVTAVWQIIQDSSTIRSVITSFPGLEHRLEFIRELDGIKYYNDSFASTPDAGSAAIEAVQGPKVMIMGGFDRFAESISKYSDDIRKILLIGQSGQRVAQELSSCGFTNYELSSEKLMGQIVAHARSFTQNGDSVVLSPGFASFDMFKNFEQRGQEFKSAVEKL